MKMIPATTFAIAVMMFAFNTNPVMAKSTSPSCPKGYHWGKMTGGKYACLNTKVYGQINEAQTDELEGSDRTDIERELADSGNEGSTSAASAGDQ